MEFLREILGKELYKQFETAINAYNGDEANKDHPVKIGNLGGGEYVGKGKYDGIVSQLAGKQTELDTANGLIAELKKGTKGNEELQGKITGYETQVADLQKQLRETKIKSAIKVALLSEKAVDVDYMTFKLETKLKDENRTLELDDNGNIKGWNDIIFGLKTQFPQQFEASTTKKIDEHKLEERRDEKAVTKNEFSSMSYEQRVALKKENETLYKQLTGKD